MTKDVIFTKLELNASQKSAHITYEIDTGADGNLMPIKVSRCSFQYQQ